MNAIIVAKAGNVCLALHYLCVDSNDSTPKSMHSLLRIFSFIANIFIIYGTNI